MAAVGQASTHSSAIPESVVEAVVEGDADFEVEAAADEGEADVLAVLLRNGDAQAAADALARLKEHISFADDAEVALFGREVLLLFSAVFGGPFAQAAGNALAAIAVQAAARFLLKRLQRVHHDGLDRHHFLVLVVDAHVLELDLVHLANLALEEFLLGRSLDAPDILSAHTAAVLPLPTARTLSLCSLPSKTFPPGLLTPLHDKMTASNSFLMSSMLPFTSEL